ncbi:MAG: DNA polymerase III subunit delta, partial [Myxococcota bacterium]
SEILRSEAVTALRARVLTQAPDFNRDELRGSETTVDRILEAARTLPMMAAHRWVHVSDAHKLKAEAQEALAAYVKAPSPTTVLVLSGEKIDGRRKLGQALNKKKVMFAFDAPKQWELGDWIEERAEHKGLALDRDAAALLGDFVGAEVGPIDRALEKLELYAGEPRSITAEDVQEVVAPTRVHSIFELTDAVGARNLSKSTQLLRNALEGGESGLMVLAMIARQMRQLLQYQLLSSRRMPNAELARALGVKPFLMNRIAEQARQYNKEELSHALDAAHRADIAMKSSRLSHGVILDRLLLEVVAAP